MHCDRVLIFVIVYYFQIWKQKEHNIIIISVINSHMGPVYIETPYTSLYLQGLSFVFRPCAVLSLA